MTGQGAVKLDVDLSATAEPFRHCQEACVGSGHAALALRADWQAQMRKCHGELGFQCVHFHGLLDDDMSVCVGEPDYPGHHFHNVDLIFDFLLEIGMRPFVELTFMPTVLASGDRTVFHYRGNVTPPRDFGQWEDLVRDLVRHLAGRYGRQEVARWHFGVWHEPNAERFWTGTQEDYFELYRRAAMAIKFVDGNFRVGGPGAQEGRWVADMVEFCRKSGTPLDFVSTPCYPGTAAAGADGGPEEHGAASHRGRMADRTAEVRAQAGELPLFYAPWNSSTSCRDPYHDDPCAAAFCLKTIADHDGLVDACSYWTFSDVCEEMPLSSWPFHGGLGMLTIHGVEKPSYHAFRFLHELGTERLPVDGGGRTVDGMAVGRGPTTHVLVWNYDVPGAEMQAEEVRLVLRGFEGSLTAGIERVDAENANAKTAWEAMGRPHYPTGRQLAELRQASHVRREGLELAFRDDRAEAHFTLPPGGVARVTLAQSRRAVRRASRRG